MAAVFPGPISHPDAGAGPLAIAVVIISRFVNAFGWTLWDVHQETTKQRLAPHGHRVVVGHRHLVHHKDRIGMSTVRQSAMGRTRATIREVATAAGVSPTTVSRALAQPHLAATGTVENVRAVAV